MVAHNRKDCFFRNSLLDVFPELSKLLRQAVMRCVADEKDRIRLRRPQCLPDSLRFRGEMQICQNREPLKIIPCTGGFHIFIRNCTKCILVIAEVCCMTSCPHMRSFPGNAAPAGKVKRPVSGRIDRDISKRPPAIQRRITVSPPENGKDETLGFNAVFSLRAARPDQACLQFDHLGSHFPTTFPVRTILYFSGFHSCELRICHGTELNDNARGPHNTFLPRLHPQSHHLEPSGIHSRGPPPS